MTAAADVDDRRIGRQSGKQIRVQDALGVGGEREQADQHVAAGEERGQRIHAGKTLDPRDIALATAPAPQREAERAQRG